MKSRPPGTSRVEISRNSFAASGTSWTTKIVKATSIFPSYPGERVRESGSHRCVLIRGSKPFRLSFSGRMRSISSWMSTASTIPVSPTLFANSRVKKPGPQPKSRTRLPGFTYRSRESVRAVEEPSATGNPDEQPVLREKRCGGDFRNGLESRTVSCRESYGEYWEKRCK